MEAKHTPGPWKVINGWDKNGNGKYFPSVVLFGDEKLHDETFGRNSITVNTSHDQEVESLMANARLIAAAPELLEACIEALRYHQGGHSEIGFILRKAIKKATE